MITGCLNSMLNSHQEELLIFEIIKNLISIVSQFYQAIQLGGGCVDVFGVNYREGVACYLSLSWMQSSSTLQSPVKVYSFCLFLGSGTFCLEIGAYLAQSASNLISRSACRVN